VKGSAFAIQGAMMQIQHSQQGDAIVPFLPSLLNAVLHFVNGIINIPEIFWNFGIISLFLAFIILLLSQELCSDNKIKGSAFLLIITSLCFLIADILQWEPLFDNFSTITIPLGIPLIFIIGIFIYNTSLNTDKPTFSNDLEKNDDKRENIFKISGFPVSVEKREIFTVVLVASVILQLMFTMTFTFWVQTIHFDTTYYYHYAQYVTSGKIPYLDFTVEYPQLFFIPVLLAMIPTFVSPGYWVFYFSFVSIMVVLNIATLICVYYIALKLFTREKAFLCSCLYATAILPAYFAFATYDAAPTFLLVLSFYLFIYQKEMSTFITALLGSFTKWFPIFSLPYYLIYQIKNHEQKRKLRIEILVSGLLAVIISGPFMLFNLKNFLATYSMQIQRTAESNSFIYFMDNITRTFFHFVVFENFSLFILIVVEVMLILFYYRYCGKNCANNPLVLLYMIFLSIFVFILLNKEFSPQFLVWVTPFLALILHNSKKEISMFYLVQLIIFIEFPLLFNIVYSPGSSYSIFENSLPTSQFIFFVIKFSILFSVLMYIMYKLKKINSSKIFKNAIQ
jgi:hypothetical protein